MSVDKKIDDLIAALDRNTEALLKAGSPVTGGTAAEKPATKGKAEKPAKEEAVKITQEQVNAALVKLKDDFDLKHAKEIIKEHGKCDKMADIKPAHFQAVYDAAIAKYTELSAGGGDEDGI